RPKSGSPPTKNASVGSRKKAVAKAPSISRLVLASSPSTRDPIPRAAACTSLAVVSAVAGLAGLTSTATRVAQLVLAVFDVENTEHGSPPLANTRSGPLEHASTHHANRAQTSLTSCRLRPRRTGSPRAHLELMISKAAMVIFWTADLRVTASTRIGASSLVVANPAPSCWRTGTAGRALTRLIKETATLATWYQRCKWSGRIFRRDHRREPGGLDVQSAGLLADPLVQQQKMRMVNR